MRRAYIPPPCRAPARASVGAGVLAYVAADSSRHELVFCRRTDMAGVENPLSADQVEPHDGAGAAPQLLGDVEVALATLKRFAVSDRDAQTSQTVVEVMELMNAKIAKVRTTL